MKEYIDREAVRNQILSWAVCINHPELLSKKDTMQCVDYIPTADVVEVRHGRWYLAEDAVFRCSECGRICHELDAPYCYCGARMDKEDEDETS